MFPMLLVVSSLALASDSPELTLVAPQPSAAGATVHVVDLIQKGMTIDEVERLLGKPDLVAGVLIRPGQPDVTEGWYLKAGALVTFWDGKVRLIHRFEPRK